MKQISLAVRLGSALTLVAVAVPSLALQSAPPVGNPTPTDIAASDAAAGKKLAAAILIALAAQAGASEEDQEGIIVFAVSQGSYSDDAISNALDVVSNGASETLQKAIANVRAALLKRKLKRGTATIAGGNYGYGAGTGSGGGFTAPGVSTGGGGSSNYSN